jgi:hypothetical protein
MRAPETTSRPGWWTRVWLGEDPANAWVVPVAVGLIVVQLAYRAWVSAQSYWEGDDFQLISQTFGPGGRSLDGLLTGISGHVMPAGLYLSWVLNRISPLDYHLAAVALTLLQALASLGFLRLLLVGFGRRWGIVPPLVLYLATAFTVQSAVWWATGVQALPVQVAFFWAMSYQVSYLQSRRVVHALAATAWVVVGLLFYEKSLLVIGTMAIITVAYFTQGGARERLRTVWRDFRFSVLVNLALGVSYLALYVHFGLSFDPGQATHTPIGPTADVMVLRSWGTGIFGGPLRWNHPAGAPVSFAQPSSLLVLVCAVVFILFCRELARSRTASMRALLLPGFFLACDLLLVVAGRSSLIGPIIGYEFRYISELSAVTAAALAFATMPLRGAVEQVRPRRPSVLLDRRRPAAVACLVVALLGTTSTAAYYRHWIGDQPGKAFFSTLVADSRGLPRGTAVVDSEMPANLLWPLAYPYNTLRVLLRPLDPGFHYVTQATDRLALLGPDGHLRQLEVTPVHHALPGSDPDCAYRVGHGVRRIRLEGPFLFGGWWVKVGYIATADSAITISAGGLTQRASVSSGLHTLYFKAGDKRFDSIRLGGLIGEATLCTNDVTVGRATVAEPS